MYNTAPPAQNPQPAQQNTQQPAAPTQAPATAAPYAPTAYPATQPQPQPQPQPVTQVPVQAPAQQPQAQVPSVYVPASAQTVPQAAIGQGGFFTTGYDETAMENAKRAGNDPLKYARYWMKAGDKKRLLILDGDLVQNGVAVEPMCLHEHKLTIGDDFNVHVTCTMGLPPQFGGPACPVCASPAGRDKSGKRAYTGFFTIVDLDGYDKKDQNGQMIRVRNVPKIIAAKTDSLAKFRRKLQTLGQLRLQVFNVFRSSDRAARIGDEWDHLEKLPEQYVAGILADVTKFFIDNKVPYRVNPFGIPVYDYQTILKPKPAAEMAQLASQATIGQTFGANNTGPNAAAPAAAGNIKY